MLTELSCNDHPGAVEVLSKDIYVDDVNPGAETEAARDVQISSTQLVLRQGGFGFKREISFLLINYTYCSFCIVFSVVYNVID